MADQAPATTAGCDHEYTLNVQLTHAWCQKCDRVIPMAASEDIRDTIKAQARAAERQRIRDMVAGEIVLRGGFTEAGAVLKYLADLLDGAS